MDRAAAFEIVRTTLAADSACLPGDWMRDEVIVVEARERIGRRRFPMSAKPFSMTTMGHGVVIACGAGRLAWSQSHLCGQTRDQLFSAPTLAQVADFVAPDQQLLVGPLLSYVCGSDSLRPAVVPAGFRLEIFTSEQIPELRRMERFPHALGNRPDHFSFEMLAVAAWHNGHIIGMAGVHADNDQLWQIGIDVAAEHQGLGLGKALVSRATEAILEQGKVPYYTHNVSNIRSGNTACTLGFQLAWTVTFARDR